MGNLMVKSPLCTKDGQWLDLDVSPGPSPAPSRTPSGLGRAIRRASGEDVEGEDGRVGQTAQE